MTDIKDIYSFNKIHDNLKQFNNLGDKPIAFKDNLLKDINLEFNLLWFIYKNRKWNQDYFIYFSFKKTNKLIELENKFFREKLKFFNLQLEGKSLTISNYQNLKNELSEALKMIDKNIFLNYWFHEIKKEIIEKDSETKNQEINESIDLDKGIDNLLWDNTILGGDLKTQEEVIKSYLCSWGTEDLSYEDAIKLRIKDYCKIKTKEVRYFFGLDIDWNILFYEIRPNKNFQKDFSYWYWNSKEEIDSGIDLKNLKETIWISKLLRIGNKRFSAQFDSVKKGFVYLSNLWAYFSKQFKILSVTVDWWYLKFEIENDVIILVNTNNLQKKQFVKEEKLFINIDDLFNLNTGDGICVIKINNSKETKTLRNSSYLYKNTYFNNCMEEIMFFKDDKGKIKALRTDGFTYFNLERIELFEQMDLFHIDTYLSWDKTKFNKEDVSATAYIKVENEKTNAHSIVIINKKIRDDRLFPLFVNQKNFGILNQLKNWPNFNDELEVSDVFIEKVIWPIFVKWKFNSKNEEFEELSQELTQENKDKIKKTILRIRNNYIKQSKTVWSQIESIVFVIAKDNDKFVLNLGRNGCWLYVWSYSKQDDTYNFKKESNILYDLNNFKIDL